MERLPEPPIKPRAIRNSTFSHGSTDASSASSRPWLQLSIRTTSPISPRRRSSLFTAAMGSTVQRAMGPPRTLSPTIYSFTTATATATKVSL